MGFFDDLLLIVELSIPILLAVIAALDRRQLRSGRYLIPSDRPLPRGTASPP